MQRFRIRQCAERGPRRCARGAKQAEDLAQLLDLVLAGKERIARQQLAEDAPERPDVDFGPVARRAEEEFGGPVPQGDDKLGEIRGRWGGCVACHAEVCELDLTAVVEEEVRGFQVAMQDVVGMEVGGCGCDLEKEGLDFGGEEGLGHILEEGLEIVFEEVHDEEDTVSGGG